MNKQLTLTEWMTEVKSVAREAADIVASPEVMETYQLSGRPAQLAYINMHTMAMSRLKKHYPFIDEKDPLMAMMVAQAKLCVAKCIKLKADCRVRRQSYNHIQDATNQVDRLVRDNYKQYFDIVKGLLHD